MQLTFTKMHGLGNDFMIIDATKKSINLPTQTIKQLANRHTGIGFDQLLLIQTSNQADYHINIFNADGSEAEQCGNGLRCVARYLHDNNLTSNQDMKLQTKAGIFPVHIQDNDHISVIMGMPHVKDQLTTIEVNGEPTEMSVISLGNPHAILRVDADQTMQLNQLGQAISTHHYFPAGANVGFMHVVNKQHVRLHTYERGSGYTHACGSNACAAVIAGITNNWLDHSVTVEFKFGSLLIEWNAQNQAVKMTGPAAVAFTGMITI